MSESNGSADGSGSIIEHPFIPSGAAAVQAALLEGAGLGGLDELYASVPATHFWDGETNHRRDLAPKSERAVARSIGERLRADPAAGLVCFRGGGSAPHYVPAVCEEIAGRREFLTVFAGSAHTNRGVFQAQFEYQSLMAELLEMDVVGATCYDWGWAAAKGVRLGLTVTGRPQALVVGHVAPERLQEIGVLCEAERIEPLPCDRAGGELDIEVLRGRLGAGDVGAVYLEMPGYLGGVDPRLPDALEVVRAAGAITVLGVDPVSLGVLEAPGVLGADVACGSLQGLGIPMYAGGGEAGFLACRDEPRLVAAFPDLLVAAVETDDPDLPAYFWVNFEDTHYGRREQAADFTGTTQTLWGIVAATYLSLAGRGGLRTVGEAIIARSQYLRSRLDGVPGVQVREVGGPAFKEQMVVLPDAAPVDEVNRLLSQAGLMGGLDLRGRAGWLGNAMLVCVTEDHTHDDIDRLVAGIGDSIERLAGTGGTRPEASGVSA